MILHCSCTKCGFFPRNVGTHSWLSFLMGFPFVHMRSYIFDGFRVAAVVWAELSEQQAETRPELALLWTCMLLSSLETDPVSGEILSVMVSSVQRKRRWKSTTVFGSWSGEVQNLIFQKTKMLSKTSEMAIIKLLRYIVKVSYLKANSVPKSAVGLIPGCCLTIAGRASCFPEAHCQQVSHLRTKRKRFHYHDLHSTTLRKKIVRL